MTQGNSVVRTTGWPARYNIIALAAAAVFICYMDRVIVSIAIIPMSADFGWTPEEQGRVLSSFFIGYLLTQVAGGWLAELATAGGWLLEAGSRLARTWPACGWLAAGPDGKMPK